MIKKVLITIYMLLLIVIINIKVNAVKDNNQIDEKYYYEGTIDDDFVDNKIIVMLSKEETYKDIDYTVNDFPEIQCKSVIDLTESAMMLIRKKKTSDSLINFEKFRRILCLELINNSKEEVLSGIKKLEKREEIISAEPSFRFQLASTPNDTYVSGQWGLSNSNAYNSWDICNNASQVLVGVLDTGINSSHVDLTDNIYRAAIHNLSTTLHRDFTTGNSSGTAILEPTDSDPDGHGTHVAGIIGARGNNSLGVAGICWNVRLVSLRIADSGGNGTIDYFTNAITYAGSNNIPILNCSHRFLYGSQALKNTIDSYFGLLVCAAGNDKKNIDTYPVYPASYDSSNIITVGAIDSNNNRSSWGSYDEYASNFGDTAVDLYAPGLNVLSTVPNNGYDVMYGTSMAAPFVTGAAALLLAANNTLSTEQLKEALIDGASGINITVPDSSNYGVNINKSVLKLNIFNSIKLIAYKRNTTGETITGTWFDIDDNIVIPSSINNVTITSIGSEAFKNSTSLEEVEIPNNITSIGYEAFKNCTSLETVTINRDQKPLTTLGTNAFQGCTLLNAIIVPMYGIADYKYSAGWSSYSNLIIPDDDDYPNYIVNKYSNINIPNIIIPAGYNIMYELYIASKAAYVISVTSGTNPLIKLYNSSFVLIDSSSTSINEILLNGHTYYLSIEHSDTTTSGSIGVNIQKDINHVHIYDEYTWYDYTQHKKECLCGVSGGYEPHAVEQGSFLPGAQYATCILCGGLASVGFVGPYGNNLYPTTPNGSYILPNGVIVLASEDIDSYLNGTLVFIDPNTDLLNNYNNIPYLDKKFKIKEL